jgi:hypothetical protein
MNKKRLVLGSSILVGLSLFFLINLSFENKDPEDKISSDFSAVKAEQANEYNENNDSSPVAILSADHMILDDLNTLEERSTLVVKAKFEGNRTLKEWTEISTDVVIATGSESEIKVSKTLKGEIKSNSPYIKIYEPAYFKDNVFVSVEGYNLMNEEKEYILFLRPMKDDETYVIVGMYQGKYDLSSSELVKYDKSIETYKDIKEIEFIGEDIEFFNKLKTQVLKKYQE